MNAAKEPNTCKGAVARNARKRTVITCVITCANTGARLGRPTGMGSALWRSRGMAGKLATWSRGLAGGLKSAQIHTLTLVKSVNQDDCAAYWVESSRANLNNFTTNRGG